MNDEAPLDLRALADVESPEVVREALRRFRRRAVTRYVWVLLGAVVLVVAVLWGRTPTTLQERVDDASSAAFLEAVVRVPGATIALDKVADLGDTSGLRFTVLPDDVEGRRPRISVTGQVGEMGSGSWERYVEIDIPPGDVPVLTVRIGNRTERIPLDSSVGVPPSIWR